MPDCKLDPFYLICDNFDQARHLVPLGVKTLQLRLKDLKVSNLLQQIRATQSLCAAHDCQFILNDYWQIALDEGCDFIHLGQEDAARADMIRLKKAKIKMGLSTHSVEELKIALTYEPDYVALGPIFPTILKKMPWPPQGLHRLQEWREHLIKANKNFMPLVAIGGFNIERGLRALTLGADSVAVVTDISLNPNPIKRVNDWLKGTKRWREISF